MSLETWTDFNLYLVVAVDRNEILPPQVFELQSLSAQVLTHFCCEFRTGKVSVLSLNLSAHLFGYVTPLLMDLGALYGL